MRTWRALALIVCASCAAATSANVDAVNLLRDGATDTGSGSGSDGSNGGCAMQFTGVLATWDFTGQPGDQASTPVSATAPGGVAGDITRAPGLVAMTGAGSINSNSWPTAATLDPSAYYTISLTPPSGCTLSLTAASIDAKASGTGPKSCAVATSDDNFMQTATCSTSTPSVPVLSVSGANGAVEVRIYGYAATGSAGTLRVENTLSLSGSFN